MLDFYGNEYIKSSWWDTYASWFPYQVGRKPVILAWLVNTVERLKKQGYTPIAQWGKSGASEPATATDAVVIYLPSVGNSQGILLSGGDYDYCTKRGVDPAAQVVVTAKGQKWIEDHTPPKTKK